MKADLGTEALRLAEAGCHVFRLSPRSKVPPSGTNGFYNATRDPDLLRRWWTECPDWNIGIATGATGVVVIDLDGPEGVANFDALQAAHGAAPTITVRTVRAEGGRHLWYQAPPNVRVGIGQGKLAPKVDHRGDRGYVVAPPSVRESGRRYEWVTPSPPLAPLPGWIAERLKEAPPRVSSPMPYRQPVIGGSRALEGLFRTVAEAPVGERNGKLFWAAHRVAERIGTGDVTTAAGVDLLLCAAAAAGLPEREVHKTVASAFRSRP